MKKAIGIALASALLIYGASAFGEEAPAPAAVPTPSAKTEELDWGPLPAPAPPVASRPEAASAAPAGEADPIQSPAEVDVVDAHWMALTMWGEARREGELGMRAVGHVIDNRRRSGRHGGYATDAVSEAYQFSCWNANDPNRPLLDNIHRLRPGSAEHRAWEEARAIAAEILAGRSEDPTGGALFYHTVAVAPAWSRGVAPVRRIGSHLFFLTAR